MIVDKQIDFFWLIVSMGHSLGSQIEPVGRPGPHKAAKSTQQGCQEQADRAIRGQMDPARAPGAARSSQLRPDRASQGGPGRLAASSPAGQLDKPRREFSIWIDSIETCRHRWEGGATAPPSTPPGLRFFFAGAAFGPRTGSERTLHGPRTDPKRTPNGPRADPGRTPNGPRTNPRPQQWAEKTIQHRH